MTPAKEQASHLSLRISYEPSRHVASAVKAATLIAAGQTALIGVVSAKAAALAHGALKALLLAKLKVVLLVLLALGIAGGVVYATRSAAPRQAPVEPPARHVGTGPA